MRQKKKYADKKRKKIIFEVCQGVDIIFSTSDVYVF